MHSPSKPLPRFVPTLTEVVLDTNAPPVAAATLPASPNASRIAATAVPACAIKEQATDTTDSQSIQTSTSPSSPQHRDIEQYLLNKVLQQMDIALDQRLREVIAVVVQEQTRTLLPRLREEIEWVVRNTLHEAISDLPESDFKDGIALPPRTDLS